MSKLQEEFDRLTAIVNKLPLTKDRQRVIPSADVVWVPTHLTGKDHIVQAWRLEINDFGVWVAAFVTNKGDDVLISECYSSLEAAQKAENEE